MLFYGYLGIPHSERRYLIFQSVPGISVEMMCEIHVRPEAVCIGCNKTALWWAVVRGIIGEGMEDN